MVGTRIAPDGYDIVVWRLDESAAPFVNSSTSVNSPGSSANLTVLSGSPLLQQPSPFALNGTNSSVQFSGNDSGSPRNFISGANSFLPQPPMTVSMWCVLRSYNGPSGLTQHGLSKRTTTGVWSGTTFSSLTLVQNEIYASRPTYFDFSITYNAGGNGVNASVTTDINVPLNQWCHVGFTYDGTNVDGYINGNNVSSASGGVFNAIYYSGTPGPWFVGAIPSGSGNPEESCMSFCDIRIANVIRPLSYFQNIYQNAILNINSGFSIVTKYYKMRAFDLGCARAFPVYWVDTAVNYSNAPSPPCGGPLGPIEIMEIYPVLNG